MGSHRSVGVVGRIWRGAAVLAVVGLAATGCVDQPEGAPRWDDPNLTDRAGATQVVASAAVDGVAALPEDAAAAGFSVRGSVEQAAVTGAEPGSELALYDHDGTAVAVGSADSQGSMLFREVRPGDGYRVATVADGQDTTVVASEQFEVVSIQGSTPAQSFYESQRLEPGYTYIETRDGTTLSTSVYLPGPIEDGPYPTVVEYSGYSPSKPAVNLLEQRWNELSATLPGLRQWTR